MSIANLASSPHSAQLSLPLFLRDLQQQQRQQQIAHRVFWCRGRGDAGGARNKPSALDSTECCCDT